MPICENPNKTAPLPTEVDHHAEAAKVKKTREQAYFNSYDFDAIEVLPSEEDDDAQTQTSVKEPENGRQNGAAVANAYLKRLTLYFSNSGKHRKSVKKRSSVGVEGIQNVCERSSSSSSSTEDSSSKLYSSKRNLDDKKTANGFLLPRAMLKYQCSLGNSMSATAAGASTSITSSKIRSIKSVVAPGDSSSCGINSKHNQCSTRTSTENSGFTQCYDKSDRDRVISASHYSTEKSGSSGYYGSNLCSSSSVEDHIYSEPVIDIIEPRVPSLGNLSSHPSIKDDGSKDSGSCKTLTNADKITENLRILETSLENLDRHLKSYSKNGTHQRASSFAGYSFHTCLSSYEKAKSDQLPTIMEGGDCQSNKKTTNSWSEDTDSLVDIDLDSFLLENERKKPAKNKSESLKGIDNPTFEQSEILDEDLENNYKCSKYVNSCPENAYKVESVIETEQEDKSLAFFLKKYEDQIHFQSTREMLEEIRDKLRILVQSANGENTDIPKDLENNIATLKVELEAYLRIMSHTSEMEIKQFCTGVVNNQKLVTMTKAFERRKSLTSSEDCEITYEAIRSGSSPADIDNTSVRCSDPNFKLKRKTLAEIFPNTDEECYNSNNNNINNSSSSSNDTLKPKTEEIQALSSTGFNSSHLQRNLSFQRPKLDNTNSKIQQEKDTILEWHKNKPSIWELYYGTNRKNQSLVGKRGQMVKNSASLMSYVPPIETTVEEIEKGQEGSSDRFNEPWFKDIGMWPDDIKPFLDYWIEVACENIQYCDDKLLKEKSVVQQDGNKIRKCTQNLFFRKKLKLKLKLKLSKETGEDNNPFWRDRFCDWKHAQERLTGHEKSMPHFHSMAKFKNLLRPSSSIDTRLQNQINKETLYWREVLKRVYDTIVFLSERALPFRGDNEEIGSARNGNFLRILEFLAKYDEFMRLHLQRFGNCGTGKVNYLSSTIYEELIEVIGQEIFQEIIRRIKTAKFFSVSVDGTADAGHVDQLTIVLRYLEENLPVERFLTFLANQGHKASDMYGGIINFLEQNTLSIQDCRGQSYDNASAMSGKFNGLQALIAKDNELAIWVPCFGHSLNLTCEKASDASEFSIRYFALVQAVFVFFSASDIRWELLVVALKANAEGENILVPKRVESTRWSSYAESARAFKQGYNAICETLDEIAEDSNQNPKTRCEASGLRDQMHELEMGIMASFWSDILPNVHKTSKTLQTPTLDFNTAVALVKSLREFISAKRDSFELFEKQVAELVGHANYKKARTPEAVLSDHDRMRVNQLIPIVDTFVAALDQRISAYEQVHLRFGFLSKLQTLTQAEIVSHAQDLMKIYHTDLDADLPAELAQFKEFCKDLLVPDPTKSHEQTMYNLLKLHNVQDAFPNVEIVLRIYLTLMISNCTGERSFSKLKLIKSPLRTSMTEKRLNCLTIMSIESDVLRSIDPNVIINKFAAKKARKVFL